MMELVQGTVGFVKIDTDYIHSCGSHYLDNLLRAMDCEL